MTHSGRIASLSRVLAPISLFAIAGLVVIYFAVLLQPDWARQILREQAVALPIAAPIGAGTLAALLVAGAGILALQITALWQTYRLFRCYGAGNLLGLAPARHLTRLGQCLFALPFALTAFGAVASVLLTRANPPGERALAIDVSSHDLGYLIGGALIWLVAGAMREAARIDAENKSFV